MNLKDLTIKKIQSGLKSKEFSAREVASAYLAQIDALDSDIGAYLSVSRESALNQAQRVDERISEGAEIFPMEGVPLGIKDNILIEGEQATAGSKILEGHKAVYDATVVKKLKSQNAIFLGKVNCDEFAMGSSTENSAYKATKNPRDLSRVPGGSSGGSAAAVAADMATASLGSDTGGSIRQPAHFCGVVGLKPTYGAVSRYGLIALSSSLDQIGPLAKTVEDAEILFNAIRGKDPYDDTTVEAANDKHQLAGDDVRKLRIGLPKEYFIDGIEAEVKSAVQSVIDFYAQKGIEVKEVSLPHTKYALSTYYIIQPAEASSNLARFDGIRYSPIAGVERDNLKDIYKKTKSLGYGAEPKRRVMLGTFVLSSGYYDAFYKKALEAKEYIAHDFLKVFEEVDVLLTPVAPTRAFKFGEKVSDPLSMYLSDIFTIPVNLAGLPAISIPVRLSTSEANQLPIGFQLIGRHFREADILSLGRLYDGS